MRVEEIQALVADVVLPPPDMTVSQRTDENRLVLDAEAYRIAAEGGPVREAPPTVARISHSRWMQG